MKYIGMPFAVWQFFCSSFEKNLPVFFDITKADAKSIMAKAKEEYKEIIEKLPDSFEVWQLFFARKRSCAAFVAASSIYAAVVFYV